MEAAEGEHEGGKRLRTFYLVPVVSTLKTKQRDYLFRAVVSETYPWLFAEQNA